MYFTSFKHLCRGNLMLVERAIEETYRAELPSSPFTAIDGGAHTGYHTTRLAMLQACHKVMAVEADPFTVQRLQKTIKKQDERVRAKIDIVEMALQEDPERASVQWMSSSSHPGRSGVSSIWQNDASVEFRETMSAQATTIDKLSARVPAPVKMIKLDLEGGDYMALKGAEAVLKRDRPLVVFENSVRAPAIYGFSIADVVAYFAALDYAPVTFAGERASEATWFDFWEMWAAPAEAAPALCARLKAVTQSIVAAESR